jgi:hypothetical protein
MIHGALIIEVKNNMSDYMQVFGSDEGFNYIINGLYLPQNSSGIAFEDKWMILLDMSHIFATCYN